MRSRSRRGSLLHLIGLGCLFCGISLLAQNRAADEGRRERWQKVDAIFEEMSVRPGAIVADI